MKALNAGCEGAVQHSVLDQIRSCSSTPDEAVDFFTRILHPDERMRPTATQALEHPYIRRCAAQMRAYQQSQDTVVEEQGRDLPDEEVHANPGKRNVLVQAGGAVREQGGRLARTASRVFKRLPLFKGGRSSVSKSTAGSGSTSSTDTASSISSCRSSSSSSSKPPLSAYFFAYKHEPEQHSPMQDHHEASAGGAEPCIEHKPESPREQQSPGLTDKVCSGAISMQAWTSRHRPPGTDQQTSGVPKLCGRQAMMPVGQVAQTGHPKHPVPVAAKEQNCSALSAVPAAKMPCQPDLHPFPVDCDTDEEELPPVVSASRRYSPRSPFLSA